MIPDGVRLAVVKAVGALQGAIVKAVTVLKDAIVKAVPTAIRVLVILGQGVLVVVAFVLAYYHAFPTSLHAKKIDYPVIDTVTLGLLGFVVVAILLPRISEVTIAGNTVKLRDAEKAAEKRVTVAAGLANLAQNWSTSIGLLSEQLENAPDDAVKLRLLQQYYRDRMGEATEYLTDDPNDVARVYLWLFDSETKTIDFIFSNAGAPTRETYDVGEGMIGKAFEEGRSFNESDVRVLPCYVQTRAGGPPPYRAVLAQPVRYGEEKIGMLTVDKRAAEHFGTIAEEIAKGLSAQCAMAYVLWRES